MNTRSRSLLFNVSATLALFGACTSAQRMRNAVSAATAIMYNASGAPIGTAQLSQDANGLVTIEIASMIAARMIRIDTAISIEKRK